jgi:hypothetical protein
LLKVFYLAATALNEKAWQEPRQIVVAFKKKSNLFQIRAIFFLKFFGLSL